MELKLLVLPKMHFFHIPTKTKYCTLGRYHPVTDSSMAWKGCDYKIKPTPRQSLKQYPAAIQFCPSGTVSLFLECRYIYIPGGIEVQLSDNDHVRLQMYHMVFPMVHFNILIESAPIKLFEKPEEVASDFQKYNTNPVEHFKPLPHPQSILLSALMSQRCKELREVLKQGLISICSTQTSCIQPHETIRPGSCRGSDLHGKLKIGAWKLTAGRSKSWKSCPREKLPTRRQKERGRHPSCGGQLPHHCQQSNTLSEPASLLKRCASFRKARRSLMEQGQQHTRKKKRASKKHLEFWDYAQQECYMPGVRQAGKCSPSQQDTIQGDRIPHQETMQQSLTLLGKTATAMRRPETIRTVRSVSQDTFWEHREQFRLQIEKALAHSCSPSSDKAKLTIDGAAAPVCNAGRDGHGLPKRKDGRKRCRAIHKIKIPNFSSFNSVRDFLTRRWVGLVDDASKLLALRVIGHDNGASLLRAAEKKESQLNLLSFKYEQAITRQRKIRAMADKMTLELREHDNWLNQWSARMVESTWIMRKKPPITLGKELQFIGNPSMELCCRYGVSTLQELSAWYDWQSMALVKEINQP